MFDAIVTTFASFLSTKIEAIVFPHTSVKSEVACSCAANIDT